MAAKTDRHAVQATSVRFTDDEVRLLDLLGARLAPQGHPPLRRMGVLRIALDRLARAEGLAGKNPGKRA